MSENLVVVSGNAAKDLSITVRTNGDGEAVSAVANYNEDLSTPFALNGGSVFGGTAWPQALPLMKKTGHSAEKIAYITINNLEPVGDADNDAYNFKIVDNESHWYGLPAEGDNYWFLRTTEEQTLSDAKNIQLRADKAGDYEIKVDYSTVALKISITFPEQVSSAVTVTAPEHGTITVKNGETPIGETVTEGTVLTIMAASADETAYEITNLRAFKTGDEETVVTITDGQLTMPAFPITITANEAEVVYQTIYFVNKDGWETVKAYVYLDEEHKYKEWPGEAMTKTEEKAKGKDIYSYRFPAKYTKIIFNDGGENQTENHAWNGAKPYICNGLDYATAEDVVLDATAKYYIVGNAAVMGAWDPTAVPSAAEAYTFSNLPAGTYKFRISLDGTWDSTKGYSDLTDKHANLRGADDNNITFTLDKATDVTITYTNEVFKLEGDFAVPAIAVACSANAGSWENPLAFTVANDKKSASYTFENLAAGDYEFKIVCNDTWLSLPATEEVPYTFHRGWTGAKDLIINMEPNMKFQADIAGDYTITWVFANDSMYFTYPDLPTYALTIANPANGTIFVQNGDDAVASGTELLAGTVLTIAANPASGYEITNLRAYKTGDENTIVVINNGQLTMPAFPITITADAERDIPSAINELNGENKAVKMIKNGQVFILRGEKVYTVMGQETK